jgi:beta-N-acetylhexosaminidase
MDMATVSRQAIEAGNDMILLTRTRVYQEQAWNLLIRLLEEDDGFRDRVAEAVRRILLLKLRWLKRDFPLLPNVEAVARSIPASEASDFSLNSSCRAVTVIAAEDLPLKPSEHDRILLVGQADHFFEVGRGRLPQAAVYDFPFYPMEWSRAVDRQRLPRIAAEYDVVVFCLTSQNSLEVLSTLQDYTGRLYVISALAPVHVASVPWVRSVLAVYGLGRDSFRAGFAALLGDFEAEGELPIRGLISLSFGDG